MKKGFIILALGWVGVLSFGVLKEASATDSDTIDKEGVVAEKTIEQVQATYTEEWLKIPGIEGTGIGLCEGKPCIKVFSSRPAEELKGSVPSAVEGYPVTIEKTGVFRIFE